MSLDRIPGDQNIFIGGLFSLRRYNSLKAANITHVVSVLRLPLDQELFRNFKHHVVDIDDFEDENIIRYFADSNRFIQEGLEDGGGVLVHCAMGKSRSTTMIIAFLLSTLPRQANNTPETILALIRQSRPFAEPNPGFMTQLSLYHRMNMPSSQRELEAHPEYQQWLYQRAVEDSNLRGVAPEVREIRFADTSLSSPPPAHATLIKEEEMEVDSTAADSTPQTRPPPSQEPIVSYRCRRCRHQLATSSYVLDHAAGDTINFAARSNPLTALRTFGLTDPSDRCAHLFVEPLSWMRPELELGKIEGRFECPNPKCRTSVGRYAWQGMRCSCGAWVVPGVSLGWAKIDEVKETIQAVRRPPGDKMSGRA